MDISRSLTPPPLFTEEEAISGSASGSETCDMTGDRFERYRESTRDARQIGLVEGFLRRAREEARTGALDYTFQEYGLPDDLVEWFTEELEDRGIYVEVEDTNYSNYKDIYIYLDQYLEEGEEEESTYDFTYLYMAFVMFLIFSLFLYCGVSMEEPMRGKCIAGARNMTNNIMARQRDRYL